MIDLRRAILDTEFESLKKSKAYDKYVFDTVSESMITEGVGVPITVALMNFNNSGYINLIDTCYKTYINTVSSIDGDKLTATLRSAAIRPDVMAQNYTITSMDFNPLKYFSPMYATEVFKKLMRLSLVFANPDKALDYDFKKAVADAKAIDIASYQKSIALSSVDGSIINGPNIPNAPIVPVTAEFLNTYELASHINVTKERELSKLVKDIVQNANTIANTIMNNINPTRMTGNKKFIGFANQFMILSNRAIISMVRYVSTVYAIHVESEVSKLNSLILLTSSIDNLTSVATESGALTTVISYETDDIANALMQGDNSIFEDLSHSVYNYHNVVLKDELEETGPSYDKTPYNNTLKMIATIINGIDLLLKFSDDFVDSYDNMAIRSGLIESPNTKYGQVIEDLSKVQIIKGDVSYKAYFEEISDFGENTRLIADNVKIMHDLFVELKNKYCTDTNTEYDNLLDIQNVRALVEKLDPEIFKLIKRLGDALMKRIRELIIFTNDHLDEKVPNGLDNPIRMESYEDFSAQAVLADMEIYSECANIDLIDAQKAVYLEKYRHDRGLREVYLEVDNGVNGNDGDKADGVSSSGQQGQSSSGTKDDSQQSQNSTGNDQKKQDTGIVDNSVEKKNADAFKKNAKVFSRDRINIIINALKEFWSKIKSSFDRWMGKIGRADSKWVLAHKQYLLNRSYSNVTLKTVPYHKMGEENIKKFIASITANIGTLDLPNLKSEEDILRKLYSSVSANNAPWTDSAEFKAFIGRYLLVGEEGKDDVVEIANGELKDLVKSTMVPYVEKFPNTIEPEIMSQLDALGDKLANTIQKYEGQASPMEADGTQNAASGGTTTGKEEETSMSLETKAKFLNSVVSDFRGKVLNAIRNTQVSYVKYLRALASTEKATVANDKNAQNNTSNQANPQPNNPQQDTTQTDQTTGQQA